MAKRKRVILAILLVLSIANYARLSNDSIRMVDLLSILVMGALGGLLFVDVMSFLKGK